MLKRGTKVTDAINETSKRIVYLLTNTIRILLDTARLASYKPG